MNRPTEYQTMKRLLFWNAENVDDFTRHEANLMIYDSVQSAYDKLSDEDKAKIDGKVEILKRKMSHLGKKGYLSIIASAADFWGVK